MSSLEEGKDQRGAAQVMAGMGSRTGLAEYAESGQGRQPGDWMVFKFLVSKEVNITLGSRVSS